MNDSVQRFLFEDLDIRGARVRLSGVWHRLMRDRDYPEAVARLLGELCATTVLLADNLKQPARLTLQLRGQGPVSLLVIDCSQSLNLRCMAHHEGELASDAGSAPLALLGDGQLMLSLDADTMREPYQSIVPVVGKDIAAVFEHYLEQSEQLASRFFLASSAEGVSGLFLQKMPGADARDADGWARIEALASTLSADELLGLDGEALLRRLFAEEDIRLFAAREITSQSPQDWDKVRNMLRTLGRDEVYAALKDAGAIVIRDDLANHEYRFDKAAIDELFSNVAPTPPGVH